MSNHTVGQVYEAIIKEVLESSKQDFDESGFEESILEELKQGWQKRLSQLGIATFPWDPKPEALPVNNAPAPSLPEAMPAPTYTQAQLSPPSDAQHMTLPGVSLPPITQNLHGNHIKPDPVTAEPAIKQEPGIHGSPMQTAQPTFAPNLPGAPSGGVAAQRAMQHMAVTFGSKASGSIGAMHQAQMAHPGSAQGQAQPGQRPPNAQPASAQEYRARMAAQMQQQQQQRLQQAAGVHAPNGLGNSQVDGTGETYEGVIAQRRADGGQVELGRVEIDSMLHEQIAARAKQMEGGGLMVPLKQATKHKSTATKRTRDGIPQGDAADDEIAAIKDEIPDDDAINSDLDDPDDDQDEEEEDDGSDPLMLCMYDKVQRVKNKWKCTLKDGVLTVNGKDYVFHKATGEYEW